MQTEYKPTLRFNAAERLRVNDAAEKKGMKPSEWIRWLVLENAPKLEISNPLKVRVDEFDDKSGWNLLNFSDVVAYATANNYPDLDEVATYMERFTKDVNGDLWVDADKLPGVSASDVTSTAARAVDLCREIHIAHVKAHVATERG